jgi:hypothetical protein
MAFQNTQYVALHTKGWLHSASTHQETVLLHAATANDGTVTVSGAAPYLHHQQQPTPAPSGGSNTDVEFSSTLHSRGQLNLTFTATPPPAAVEGARRWVGMTSFPITPKHTTTCLYGYARAIAEKAPKAAAPTAVVPPSDQHQQKQVWTRQRRRDRSVTKAGGVRSTPDFPFNKSYGAEASIGPNGKDPWQVLNANYSADLFIGTNFVSDPCYPTPDPNPATTLTLAKACKTFLPTPATALSGSSQMSTSGRRHFLR